VNDHADQENNADISEKVRRIWGFHVPMVDHDGSFSNSLFKHDKAFGRVSHFWVPFLIIK